MKFVFQPIIELRPRKLLGFEALTRFDSGQGPAEVFAVARREGRLLDLERAAISGIISASAALPSGVLTTLNASGPTIDSFASSGLKLDDRLVWGLELNELSAPCVSETARGMADTLGCLLLVDDAGVAHATEDRILSLRPDIVKLDRSMIVGYEQSSEIRELVDTLVVAAARVGSKTLAEGIETTAQLELAETLGFDYVQGFYFSPGQPPTRIASTLQDLHRRFGIDVPGF